MRRRAKASRVLVLLAAAWPLAAQRNGSSALVLQVNPEAVIAPQQIRLQFFVSADGSADVVSQQANVAAAVRAAAGQTIRFTATLSSWVGPAGPATPAALNWSGSVAQASGGARQASCTSGSFTGTSAQTLAQGWTVGGSLGCNVTFQLTQPRGLAPGAYTALVSLFAGW